MGRYALWNSKYIIVTPALLLSFFIKKIQILFFYVAEIFVALIA